MLKLKLDIHHFLVLVIFAIRILQSLDIQSSIVLFLNYILDTINIFIIINLLMVAASTISKLASLYLHSYFFLPISLAQQQDPIGEASVLLEL